jgi:hypothetical protein
MFASTIPSCRLLRLRGTNRRHFQYISSSLLLDEKQNTVQMLFKILFRARSECPFFWNRANIFRTGQHINNRRPLCILLTLDKSKFNCRRIYKLMSPWLNLVPPPTLCWLASIYVELKCVSLRENFKTVSPVMPLSGLLFVFTVTQVLGRTI